MADVVAGITKKVTFGLFGPHPNYTIVTFWQGIVEIILRAVSMVLALICIIAAAVALADLNEDYKGLDEVLDQSQSSDDWNWDSTAKLSKSACGFLMFVSVMIILIEFVIIALRFLNFGIVDQYIQIFLIVDIIISGVLAFLLFCIAVATAVYAQRFAKMESNISASLRKALSRADLYKDAINSSEELNEDMGGVAAFSFFTLFLFVGLAVFMGTSFMLGWRNSKAKYAGAGKGVDPPV